MTGFHWKLRRRIVLVEFPVLGLKLVLHNLKLRLAVLQVLRALEKPLHSNTPTPGARGRY